MTFRHRILMAVVPLLVLLVILGGTATFLLNQLGHGIDQILRENYVSVIAMRDLNEALERIDSSFQFALAGREKQSQTQFRDNWKLYEAALKQEADNITLPGEGELVESLQNLTSRYRQQGEAFFKGAQHVARDDLYFGRDSNAGLYATFGQIKAVAAKILELNQDNMVKADRDARRLARSALIWYGGGLAVGLALALLLIGNTIRTILDPIRAVTESAAAIGAGNLDQVVPKASDDELGQLAAAFNHMARQLRDMRQSHKAQLFRAQHTSQATIDSFPDPVLVVDGDQQVESANPAARRLLNIALAQPGASPPAAWQPPERLREPLAAALREHTPYVPEGFDKAVVVRVGDESHTFLPRILPIRDAEGATLGAAVVLEDITRFRLLDEIKTNLVATVSHELKTPLTSIRLVLHLLLEEQIGPLAPKQLELVVDARDNAERLLTMINNLLDLARLEQGRTQLRLRPERPMALLEAAAESFRPRAADAGVEFVVQVDPQVPPVAADAEQFQHALHNLLDNALVHTPQSGTITLAAEPQGEHVVFSVSDTGSGIPAEYLPLIFEKYFRVPGETKQGGSGLGLAIVREIATAHGGQVRCESQAGQRTTFFVSLPVWKAAQDNGQSGQPHTQYSAW